MKVFGEKSISSNLHVVFKYGFYGCFFWVGYILIAHLLGAISYGLNFSFGLFDIAITQSGYTLEIWPEIKLISSSGFLGSVVVLGLFSWLTYIVWIMSGLFKQFSEDQIFSDETLGFIKKLAWLLLISSSSMFIYLLVKLNYPGTSNGIRFPDQDLLQISFLFVFSIFLFFIGEIFKRGIFLQKEQDLTI